MTGSGGVEGEEQRQQPIPAKENDGGEQKAGKLADGKQQLLDRRHFHEHFDTDAYLQDFYSRVDEPAMQLVLFHLPNLVARLGPLDSLLDFGCGPTIHVAVCFRETAQNIFLADYLPQNRAELSRWMDGHSHFDWSSVLRIIAAREAIPFTELANMEQQAREKVRAILHCDCLACPAVQQSAADASGPMGSLLLPTFGAITTFFTLEYCCLDRDEYEAALRRICQHLGPGGRLIMGGVLEETWCAFGGRQYKCLFLELDFVLDCLRTAGLELERGPLGSELLYEQDGMFLLVAKKRVN